jgi:hypothetical protein
VTTCLDLPAQRSARALAQFRRTVIQGMGPKSWERYAGEFQDLASLYSRGKWRPEDYDLCQLIMLSIIDDVLDPAPLGADAGQGGAA